MKEWLEQHKLEEVQGALLQLGVKTVEHLYMIEEQVGGCLTTSLNRDVVCATAWWVGHTRFGVGRSRLGPRREHAWLQRHSRSRSGDGCDRPYLKRDRSTKGPSWGYPVPVLGAVCPLLSTFGKKCPRLPKNLIKLTFEYPHEGPCVVEHQESSWCRSFPD